MSINAVSSKKYFHSIDGLRLFAAINVVLFHYEISGGFYSMQYSPSWFFTIVKGPGFHASLFFILAGFIYTIKYATHVYEFSTKRFMWSRIKDLYPLHVTATLR